MITKRKALNLLKGIAECVDMEEQGSAEHITEYVSLDDVNDIIEFVENN